MTERLWEIITSSFTDILIPGLTLTVPMTVLSFAFALIIATVCAMLEFSNVKIIKDIIRIYIWIARGTPVLVQLFVVFYGLPSLGIVIDPFPSAVIVFSLNEGAYCAETIRAAMEAVPIGQLEAAQCGGMSYLTAMRRIVLPQAFRTAFPSLSNNCIALLKDTSLASNITVAEMFMATQRIVARTYEPLALYIEVGVIYLIFSTVLTLIQRYVEKRMNMKGRR